MGLGSGWHWILFLLVAVLLFGGGGKISSLMGDVAKGIKSFKKGMSEDDEGTVRTRRARSACDRPDGDAARGRRAQQDRLKPRPCRGRLRRGDRLEGLAGGAAFLPAPCIEWAKPFSSDEPS